MKKTILEIATEHNINYKPIGDGVYRASCPFHINLNTPSFTLYSSTESWFCFGESIGGDSISFLSKLDNISYSEAKKRILGDTTFKQEMEEQLDGLSVKDEPDYKNELNIKVSQICRDAMIARPARVDNIMAFLKELDTKWLHQRVDSDILKMVIEKAKELSR